jgi:flavin reductase (DIM6/NTAB) family NADH-FMN oxidoreductase RutF
MVDVCTYKPDPEGRPWSWCGTASLDPARVVGWVNGDYDPHRSRRHWRPILDTGAIADVNVTDEGRAQIEAAQAGHGEARS